jgi:hypothetical protein
MVLEKCPICEKKYLDFGNRHQKWCENKYGMMCLLFYYQIKMINLNRKGRCELLNENIH